MTPPNALCSFLLSLTITAYIVVAVDSPSPSSLCSPDQRDALLQLKNSFSISERSPFDLYDACMNTSYPKTASWNEDKDCCSWEGVVCDDSTGDILDLDLSCARLFGTIEYNSSLFSLRHLRSLSLAGNKFIGIIPREISLLSKLVSLNLSSNELEIENPTMAMLVGNLTWLEELDLSSNSMYTVTPTSLMNFSSSLISLNLSACSLGGKFPENIFQLPNLQRLDLSLNSGLNGTLPASNWSRSFAFLSLEDCSFAGVVPHSIGSLTRLTYLDLSYNNFTGHVDFQTFSTLKNLSFLGLSGLVILEDTLENFPCFFSSMPELRNMSLSWSNVSEFRDQCINNGLSFPLLLRVEMKSCKLTEFPSFLSQSKKIRFLNLMGNMIEKIPSWFWRIGIDTLEELYLGDNLLKGGLRLPWKKLAHLDVQNNLFEGPLPIPTSRSISEFGLSQNRFNGSIPPSICQLTSLTFLSLGQNNLTGVVPRCLGNLTDLVTLDLSSNSLTGPLPIPTSPSIWAFLGYSNHFNGSIHPSICHLTSLSLLGFGQNNLTGVIPPCLGNLTHLSELSLSSNSLTGPLPPSLVNCTPMQTLDVSFNFLGGGIGETFLLSTSLAAIFLSNNIFEGPLPLPSDATWQYSVSNNHFSGEISSLICNVIRLQLLDLSNNRISGTLPLCLKNITVSLAYLNLRENEFHGSIPEVFPEGCSLKSLDFSRNRFEGSLSRSLSKCESLEALDVGNNKIVDSFPNWLGDLPLKVLNLRSNKFHGQVTISEGTRPFSSIRILDISNNGFDGILPDNLIAETFGLTRMDNGTNRYMGDDSSPYSVMIILKDVEIEMVKINVQFATLDLSSNRFCGEIPRNIGLLKPLNGLNFSHNSFTGTIPLSLGNLTNLESLDLSSNHLVGGIPRELVQLAFLEALDLSWNNLTGSIPPGGHLNTFSNKSFEGNPGLCGIPLTRACGQRQMESRPPRDQRDEAGGWLDWKFVAMGFGSGMGIGISLGYIALETGRPLWLSRIIIRLESGLGKTMKRKAQRRNGRR